MNFARIFSMWKRAKKAEPITKINLNRVMDDLVSEDFETQCHALEAVSELLSTLAEQCVKALDVSVNPFLIAERLPGVGSRIIAPLERYIENKGEENSEKKVLASIVLLSLGSKAGLECVVNELREMGKNEYLAVNLLVRTKIPEAKDLIIERLRKFTIDELKDTLTSNYVSNLLAYLIEDLSTPLPADLAASFESIKDSERYMFYAMYL